MGRPRKDQDLVPSVRSVSIADAIRIEISERFKDLKRSLFKELGEHLIAIARGAQVPVQPPMILPHQAPALSSSATEVISRQRTGLGTLAKMIKVVIPLVEKVFRNQCTACEGSIGRGKDLGSIESGTMHRGKQTHYLRWKTFILFFREHGLEATREEFRYLCKGCTASNKPGQPVIWSGRAKAVEWFHELFRDTCAICDKHITTLNSCILQGPGSNPKERMRAFAAVYLTKGKEEAKKVFSMICRSCFDKQHHFGGSKARRHAAA